MITTELTPFTMPLPPELAPIENSREQSSYKTPALAHQARLLKFYREVLALHKVYLNIQLQGYNSYLYHCIKNLTVQK